METVGDHVAMLHALDYPRQERVRQRVKDVVKDPNTAEKLQAWYPGVSTGNETTSRVC